MSYTSAILLLSFASPVYVAKGEAILYRLSEDYTLACRVTR